MMTTMEESTEKEEEEEKVMKGMCTGPLDVTVDVKGMEDGKEDIIDGFAFLSFDTYHELEEWVRREEQKLRKLLHESEAGEDNGLPNTVAQIPAVGDLKAKRKRKRNENRSPEPVTTTVGYAGSSPSLVGPESMGSFMVVEGQSSDTLSAYAATARVKRSANATGTQPDETSEPSGPVKVPKRETVDGTDSQWSLSSSIIRGGVSEVKMDSPAMNNTVYSLQHQQQNGRIHGARLTSVPFPNVSGSPSSAENKLMDGRMRVFPIDPTLKAATTPSSAPTTRQGRQHKHSVCDDLGGAGPPTGSCDGGRPALLSSSVGTPNHVHTDTQQRVNQYIPLLSPLLGLNAPNLPGISGMVGSPAVYGGVVGFPPGHQILGLPTVSSQLSTGTDQTAPTKKGKWCAMHVKIAWDIYNKTILNKERKGDEGTRKMAAPGDGLSAGTSAPDSIVTRQAVSRLGYQSSTAPLPVTNAQTEQRNLLLVADIQREKQRQHEKESHQRLHALQRLAVADRIQLGRGQNGVQCEPSKIAVDQRYSNAIAPPPSSAVLPLKSERVSSSSPFFPDGLLQRQHQGHPFSYFSSSASPLGAQVPTFTDSLFRSAAMPPPSHYSIASSRSNQTPSAVSSASLEAAYRALMGLDNAAALARGAPRDPALFRPTVFLDPMVLEREREQLMRIQQQQQQQQQQQLLGARRDIPNAGAVLFGQSRLPPGHNLGALFNPHLLGGLDTATAAAAAALYSTGMLQREGLDSDQSRVGGLTADPFRLGPFADPFSSIRTSLSAGIPSNLGLNFVVNSPLTSNHSTTTSTANAAAAAAAFAARGNLINPFANGLEQLARQKLASAASYQNR